MIIEFEGQQHEFPDDFSDAEIEDALNQLSGAQLAPVASDDVRDPVTGVPGGAVSAAAAPTSTEDRSWLDTIMSGADYTDDTAAIGLTNMRKGASAVLGLPVDAVNNAPRLANLLPGVEGVPAISDTPFMGSGFIDAILGAPADAGAAAYNAATDGQAPGAEGPVPQDIFQRGVARVGQEVGAAGVPVVGAIAKASQVGVEGARQLPYLAKMFVEPAAVNAGRFAGREAATAAGAGTGAAIANEAFPDSQLADMIGAILGAGTTALGSTIGGSVKQTFDALRQNPEYLDQVVKDAVVQRVGESASLPGSEVPGNVFNTDPLVAAIDNPSQRRPADIISGYQETLADRTGNPGIAALEYGRQQGAGAGQFIQRRGANTEAVDAAMAGIEPQATPGAFREELSIERDRRLMDAIVGRENAEQAAETATRPLTPQTTPEQRGATVRGALETARDAARQRTDEAYQAVGVEGRQVDPAGLTETLDTAVAGLTEVERGLIPQGMIDRVSALGRVAEEGATPDPVSLKQATDLKSELQRLQRAAYGDPKAEKGGRNAGRVLGQMIESVDGFINRNLSTDEQAALETARGTKFEEAEAFGRQGDPVAAALARNEGGVPKLRDDQVAGSFVNPQAMDRLFTQADTPAVRASIRDEVLARGDTSSADRINRFTQEYGEQLNRFPGLRDEFEAAARARTDEAGARTRETELTRELGTPENEKGRGTVGRYLQFSDENAERAIGEVLSAKDPSRAADELLTFINDKPQAVEGARAAFWRKLKTESTSVDNSARSMGGKRAWRGDWLKSWLDNPATSAVAERLYRDKPEDLEALRAFADVLDNADLRTRARASASSGTGQGVSNIMTPETLQSRGYAWMRGQISGTYLATSIAAVMARRAVRGARANAIERLTDQVLLNPEMAKELLKENNPANRAALARKAKGWLGNEASTFVNLMNEDEDDTKEAVMRDGK